MTIGFSLGTILSLFAFLLSLYSLWSTSLQPADLRVFVPPVIHYSAPYQNSNFEMIAIPVTITNEGARSGVVLSMELTVSDPRSGQSKQFYAAELGRWSMERTRASAYQAFAPLSLAGRTSRTESVLFYTRGDEQKPPQLIRETGAYAFKLRLEQAVEEIGWLERMLPRVGGEVAFERELKFYDARAFNSGTLPMYARDWRSSISNSKP